MTGLVASADPRRHGRTDSKAWLETRRSWHMVKPTCDSHAEDSRQAACSPSRQFLSHTLSPCSRNVPPSCSINIVRVLQARRTQPRRVLRTRFPRQFLQRIRLPSREAWLREKLRVMGSSAATNPHYTSGRRRTRVLLLAHDFARTPRCIAAQAMSSTIPLAESTVRLVRDSPPSPTVGLT